MKALRLILFLLMVVLIRGLNAQNAPESDIADTTACPGSEITVPVRVTGFTNIGSMSLRMQYATSALTLVNWENTSGFPGFNLNEVSGGLLIGGGYNYLTTGFSIPDDSVFFTMTFLYHGGDGTIDWIDNGASCEFTGPFPDFIVLNDSPTWKYYMNGGVTPSIQANFTASTLIPGTGDTVQFTDLSTGDPTGWIWDISPATYAFLNGTDQYSQHPHVAFLANGAYSVSLKAMNAGCGDMISRIDYIHAGIPGLWTGLVSSDWYDPLNWNNGMIPTGTTDVEIPGIAPHWPDFTGNFTIGIQCFNLIIASNGQMIIQGDMILP